MIKPPLRFSLILFLTLDITFLVHILVLRYLELSPFEDQLILAYLTNLVLAIIIFTGLFYGRKKFKNALGFLFMGGSLIKLVVFFSVFYPTYKADGFINGSEFVAFFIPYIIALILETYFASKMLKKDEGY